MAAHQKNLKKVSCKDKGSSKSSKSKQQHNDSSDEENQPRNIKRHRCDADIVVQVVDVNDEESESKGSIIVLDNSVYRSGSSGNWGKI